MNASDVIKMMDARCALFGLFFAFNNRLQTVGDMFYDEITCKQFFLLACMNLYTEEPPTANELAKTMGTSRQNVKEILLSLEKKDIIYFGKDAKDKRKRPIYLTEKTKQIAEKYTQKETEFINCLYNGISEEEVKIVYSVISKMEDNLKITEEELKNENSGNL